MKPPSKLGKCVRPWVRHHFLTVKDVGTHNIQRCRFCNGLYWKVKKNGQPDRITVNH